MRECRLRNKASILLALVTAAAVLGSSLTHAAEPAQKVMRLGFVHSQSASTTNRGLSGFWERLAELGWVRGRNLIVEERWAEGHIERLPALMDDLVARKVDVIVTYSTPAAVAAKGATTTIPIVVASMGDPVGSGVAASLAHPGGNLTGLSLQMTEGIPGKWLELLQETVPRLLTVAVIGNPDTPLFGLVRRPLEAAASARNLKLRFIDVRAPEALETAFEQARRAAQAALVIPDPMTFYHQRRVAAQAAKDHLPGHVWPAGVRRRGRLDGIRAQSSRLVSPRGRIRGQDPQRSQSRRLAHRASDSVRAHRQSEDGPCPRGSRCPRRFCSVPTR